MFSIKDPLPGSRMIANPGNAWVDAYVIAVLLSSVLGFLSLRGWINLTVFLVLLPALLSWTKNWGEVKQRLASFVPIMLALALPVAVLLLSQALRHGWVARAYDGPVRMLLAIPLLFYFYAKRIDFARVLGVAAPLALLILLAQVKLDPGALVHWGGRFATYFVDTDTFGVYGLVLTALCLFSIGGAGWSSTKAWTLLQLIGVVVGAYLVIGSDTRAAWLALPFVIALWLYLRSVHMTRWVTFSLALLMALGIVLAFVYFPGAVVRLKSGYQEVALWFREPLHYTSAGARLTMWHMSWELFKHSPWYGYGDVGYRALLGKPWITSIATPEEADTIYMGPHNEFIANVLRSGVWGGVAVLFEFFAPFILFWRCRHHTNPRVASASQLGLAYLVCVIIASIAFEVFTLKYTASFYALIIAGLAAQVLRGRSDEVADLQ